MKYFKFALQKLKFNTTKMHISLFEQDSTSKNDVLKKNFIDFFIRRGAATIADRKSVV